MTHYIALVHKSEGTSYGVSFPDVPGCISAGDTFFAAMRADGDAIPAPRDFESLKRDPEFVDDCAGAIVTMVAPKGVMAAAE